MYAALCVYSHKTTTHFHILIRQCVSAFNKIVKIFAIEKKNGSLAFIHIIYIFILFFALFFRYKRIFSTYFPSPLPLNQKKKHRVLLPKIQHFIPRVYFRTFVMLLDELISYVSYRHKYLVSGSRTAGEKKKKEEEDEKI